ncbi:MAG: hypothetical protein Q9180_006976 [Flavoplaca navasiana]
MAEHGTTKKKKKKSKGGNGKGKAKSGKGKGKAPWRRDSESESESESEDDDDDDYGSDDSFGVIYKHFPSESPTPTAQDALPSASNPQPSASNPQPSASNQPQPPQPFSHPPQPLPSSPHVQHSRPTSSYGQQQSLAPIVRLPPSSQQHQVQLHNAQKRPRSPDHYPSPHPHPHHNPAPIGAGPAQERINLDRVDTDDSMVSLLRSICPDNLQGQKCKQGGCTGLKICPGYNKPPLQRGSLTDDVTDL